MSTSTVAVESKYYLKSVHAEIDLFDRRIAHLMKFEAFDTDAARDAAARRLNLKREPLVLTAKRLAAEGVEFKATELPRSFRPEGAPAPVAEIKEEATSVSATPAENRSARRQGSPYAGTSLDWEKSVKSYMDKKAQA